jgi:hypothetical protein
MEEPKPADDEAVIKQASLLEACGRRATELVNEHARLSHLLIEVEGRIKEVQLFRTILTTARPEPAGPDGGGPPQP